MNYELRNITFEGAPIVADGSSVMQQNITVTTGIVGDTYGFVKTNLLLTTSDMSKTGSEIKQDITAQALQFVLNTYPNT